MIILLDALVFSFSKSKEFGRYSLLINENRITDMVKFNDAMSGEKVRAWIEKYKDSAEVVDCSQKIIMPPFVNACLKSEGSLIHYLLRNRHYEIHNGDLYTDLIFNYIYQELEHDEINEDLDNIYKYSYGRNLKSGISAFNEFSLRKDANHLKHIAGAVKLTGQTASVGYPVKQELKTISEYKFLNPAYYLTDENQITIFDISTIAELKNQGITKLFLEVATNKEVTDNFHQTFGKPVMKYLDEYDLVDSNTFLINPLYLTYDEMKIIREKGASIIVCPRDLLYFTHRYFPIDDFINLGIKFTIGTGWLGEDIFKDLRFFRNKYKELNLSSIELLKSITAVPYEMFFGNADDRFNIDVNKNADMVMVSLSDIRFQFFPQSLDFDDVCNFLVDNLTSFSFSDVLINGKFKVREGKLVNIDEHELIKSVNSTRDRLYKVGKFEQLAERKKQRVSVGEMDLASRDAEEIKMFSNNPDNDEIEDLGGKEEFRIKGKVISARRKTTEVQKNLFEESEPGQFVQTFDYSDTPEFNLLFTEFNEVKEFEEEILHNKLVDEKILKQTAYEKKVDKNKPPVNESKIELPKNVKLRFGDD